MRNELEIKDPKRGAVESFWLVVICSFAGGMFTLLWAGLNSDIAWLQMFLRSLFK